MARKTMRLPRVRSVKPPKMVRNMRDPEGWTALTLHAPPPAGVGCAHPTNPRTDHATLARRHLPRLHRFRTARRRPLRDAGRHWLHPPLLRQFAVQPVGPLLRGHAPALRRPPAEAG